MNRPLLALALAVLVPVMVGPLPASARTITAQLVDLDRHEPSFS